MPAFQAKSDGGRLENRKSWLMPHNSGYIMPHNSGVEDLRR
jgi:hypothetical protein